MNYLIARDGREFGPYSLADLQRYLQSGEILPTDLARSEGMTDWMPVSQVVGNVPFAAPLPPPVYGNVPPAYGAFGGVPAPMPGTGYPLPPDLHWGIVLLLSIVTCGLFQSAWLIVEAAYVKKLRRDNNTLVLYAIAIGLIVFGSALSANADSNAKATAGLVNLGGLVLMVIGHFQMKSALEEHFNSVEPIGLHLSGVMTFFFNVVYFQYHMNRIRKWRLTGVLA